MTIEKLKSYRGICAEIKDIKSKLSGSYVGDTVQSGSKHPYSVHNVHIEGYSSEGNTLSLLTSLSVLEYSRKEIETFVLSIATYHTRKAVYLYYLAPINEENEFDIYNNQFIWDSKPSWEDVADKVGNGVTSYSLKKAKERCLKCHECHTCHK